jgi:predicted site-specific integrase-resolvase
MGLPWKYPRALVENAARLANVSERTIRRWCKAGMILESDADILRYARHKGHPPRGKVSVREESKPAVYDRWLTQKLADLARR